jgi:tRNA dimethylallyltransferase
MNELYRKIEARVDEMLEKGLVGEVKGLIGKGFGKSFAINDTIGYKEILRYINGEISLPEAVELIKKNTRRFAKRQMTWFRSEKGVRWVEVREGEDKRELLSQVETAFGL